MVAVLWLWMTQKARAASYLGKCVCWVVYILRLLFHWQELWTVSQRRRCWTFLRCKPTSWWRASTRLPLACSSRTPFPPPVTWYTDRLISTKSVYARCPTFGGTQYPHGIFQKHEVEFILVKPFSPPSPQALTGHLHTNVTVFSPCYQISIVYVWRILCLLIRDPRKVCVFLCFLLKSFPGDFSISEYRSLTLLDIVEDLFGSISKLWMCFMSMGHSYPRPIPFHSSVLCACSDELMWKVASSDSIDKYETRMSCSSSTGSTSGLRFSSPLRLVGST